MDAALEARRKLEHRVRVAINNERLEVAYQTLVDSRKRTPQGFQALLRWHDEELGNIAPAESIPVAEETGLIVALGEFVPRRACHDAVRWPGALRVAVNMLQGFDCDELQGFPIAKPMPAAAVLPFLAQHAESVPRLVRAG